MAIGKAKLESVLRRWAALDQRAQPLRETFKILTEGTIWRTQDGSLAVELSQADKQNMETWLTQYLDECQAILDSIRVDVGGS